jgi:hypothetical protein
LCAIVLYYCYIVTWEGFGSLVALASGPRRQKDFCPPLLGRVWWVACQTHAYREREGTAL